MVEVEEQAKRIRDDWCDGSKYVGDWCPEGRAKVALLPGDLV
jgi:hypothetical protein